MSHGLTDTLLVLEDYPSTPERWSAGIDPIKSLRQFKHRLRASHQREQLLYAALRYWGYHDNDCPAWEKEPCTCGWESIPEWFHHSSSNRGRKRGANYFRTIRSLWVNNAPRDGAWCHIRYLSKEHDQLVSWLEDAGWPLTDEMKDHLRSIREYEQSLTAHRFGKSWLERNMRQPYE